MNSSELNIEVAPSPYRMFLLVGMSLPEQPHLPSETNPAVLPDDDVFFDKPGPLPASKASIDAMPRVTVTDDCVHDCPICLDEISVGDEIRMMPCKHGFHSDCIEKWLVLHASCPVCRFMMPVDDGGNDVDDDGSLEGRRQRRRIIYRIVIMDSGSLSSDTDQNLDSGSENSERS